jgi:hypothetical protein
MFKSRSVHQLVGLIGALALVVVAAPVEAQGPIDTETIKVDVPFDFVAGDTTLPAGTYEIEIGIGKTDQPILAIQANTTAEGDLVYKKVFAMASQGDVVQDGPRLVFRQVGDLHFLEKVVPESGKAKEVR